MANNNVFVKFNSYFVYVKDQLMKKVQCLRMVLIAFMFPSSVVDFLGLQIVFRFGSFGKELEPFQCYLSSRLVNNMWHHRLGHLALSIVKKIAAQCNLFCMPNDCVLFVPFPS